MQTPQTRPRSGESASSWSEETITRDEKADVVGGWAMKQRHSTFSGRIGLWVGGGEEAPGGHVPENSECPRFSSSIMKQLGLHHRQLHALLDDIEDRLHRLRREVKPAIKQIAA